MVWYGRQSLDAFEIWSSEREQTGTLSAFLCTPLFAIFIFSDDIKEDSVFNKIADFLSFEFGLLQLFDILGNTKRWVVL
jgi:hypothetical protein